MVLFLKIISFPFRLVLFFVISLLTLIVSGYNHTFGLFLIFAAAVISFIGSMSVGLMVIAVIIYAGGFLMYPDKFAPIGDSIPAMLLSAIVLFIFAIPLILMPAIAEKLFEFTETASEWLWGLAKMILFCNIDELRYF